MMILTYRCALRSARLSYVCNSSNSSFSAGPWHGPEETGPVPVIFNLLPNESG